MQALLRQSLRSEQIPADLCSPIQGDPPSPHAPQGAAQSGVHLAASSRAGRGGCAGPTGGGARHGALTADTGV